VVLNEEIAKEIPMSLKFAAVGSLMALSALEARTQTDDHAKILDPAETYDPLLAMIGRGRREAEPMEQMTRRREERAASHARW